jgi:hypothetical protein
MLKSAPKWLKLMPEILVNVPIFVTQFNFKVDKLQTKCAQIKLKSKKTCAQNRYKNTGCKGFCAMERPVLVHVTSSSSAFALLVLLLGIFRRAPHPAAIGNL